MSCGVDHRRGSDPTMLWLWRRPAAVAPIQPLAWEPPYAWGVALKRQKKTKKKKKSRVLHLSHGFELKRHFIKILNEVAFHSIPK